MTRAARMFGAAPLLGRTLLALQALAAVVFLVALLAAEGVRLPVVSGASPWTVDVELADAAGLPAGRAPVLVAGVPSGKVTRVRALPGGRALVTLSLSDDVRGRVHRDAVATVEPRSALNDQTIDVTPGSPSAPALRDGDRLPLSQTRSPVAADRVLSVLDADTRAQLAVALDQLAVAAGRSPGAMRSALLALQPAVSGATRVSSALDERRALLVRLVDSVDRLSGSLSARRRSVSSVLARARRTLDAVGGQDAALRSGVATLPSTLAAVDRALADVVRVAGPLRPTLRSLRGTAVAAPSLLSSVRRATPELGGLVTDVGRLGRVGAAPAARVRSVLEQAGPVATGLTPALRDAETVVRAIDAKRDGIGKLGENFSGVLSTNDANGPILRGLGFFEDFNPANFGFAGARGAALTRVKLDVVRALVATCEKDNVLACLVRYLVPGLPGSVRALGSAGTAERR